jgi:hypothetical protein
MAQREELLKLFFRLSRFACLYPAELPVKKVGSRADCLLLEGLILPYWGVEEVNWRSGGVERLSGSELHGD